MDTSKEYIEMCAKAEEIQKLRYVNLKELSDNWENGDYGLSHKNEVECYHTWYFSENMSYSDLSKWVLLPRQDQLQELCASDNDLDYTFEDMFCEPKNFYEKNEKYIVEFYGQITMEQLWLMIYMQNKHNKFWSGCEWILI